MDRRKIKNFFHPKTAELFFLLPPGCFFLFSFFLLIVFPSSFLLFVFVSLFFCIFIVLFSSFNNTIILWGKKISERQIEKKRKSWKILKVRNKKKNHHQTNREIWRIHAQFYAFEKDHLQTNKEIWKIHIQFYAFEKNPLQIKKWIKSLEN